MYQIELSSAACPPTTMAGKTFFKIFFDNIYIMFKEQQTIHEQVL